MTKQAYIALADMIRKEPEAFLPATVQRLADFIQTQNPRFVRERWLHYIKTGEGK